MDKQLGRPDPTLDQAEVDQFNEGKDVWWSNEGPARWLHRYNPLRASYIRDVACREFQRDPARGDCLRGLRVLDIGCGGGVLCESLAAFGCDVTGIDPAPNAIATATRHARASGLAIDYRCAMAQELAAGGEAFDIVLAMEVIEHVNDGDAFIGQCASLLGPGGLAILSTLNRTTRSFVFAILLGEYVLRLLPVGTHQWKKFVTPAEMGRAFERNGLHVADVRGVTMNLRSRQMQLSRDAAVNYLLTAGRRDGRSVANPATP